MDEPVSGSEVPHGGPPQRARSTDIDEEAAA